MEKDPHAADENIPQQELKRMKKRKLKEEIRGKTMIEDRFSKVDKSDIDRIAEEKMERVMGFEPTTITLAT